MLCVGITKAKGWFSSACFDLEKQGMDRAVRCNMTGHRRSLQYSSPAGTEKPKEKEKQCNCFNYRDTVSRDPTTYNDENGRRS